MRPVTGSRKLRTNLRSLESQRPAPSASAPPIRSAKAPTTNAPMIAALARLAMGCDLFAAREERVQLRVHARAQHLARIAFGSDGFFLGVDENGMRANGENAGELVRDHDHGRAQAVEQLHDESVEQPAAERLGPGGWRVEEERVRHEHR